MDNQEKLKELAHKLDVLEETERALKRILEHNEKLSSIPSEKLTSKQRLWLLAFKSTDGNLNLETEEGKDKVAELLVTLDEEREENNIPAKNKLNFIKKIIKNFLIFISLLLVSTIIIENFRGPYSDGFENFIISIALSSLVVFVWKKIARRYL